RRGGVYVYGAGFACRAGARPSPPLLARRPGGRINAFVATALKRVPSTYTGLPVSKRLPRRQPATPHRRRLVTQTTPAEPRLNHVSCLSPAGIHRMAYWEWGDPANDRVLLCVHGLTRTGRDFDRLARHLAQHYRVVCPDV